MIISAILWFKNMFLDKFVHSKLWALIQNINKACQNAWKNSVIMNFLKRDNIAVTDSFFGRILFSPFTLLDVIKKHFANTLNKKIKSSVICELGRLYIQNFMAVNTRFWGIMMLCASVVFNAVHFAAGMGINKAVLIFAVICALLSFTNFNVTGFLNGSKFIDFAKACAGLKNISFDFYDE